MKCRVCKNKGFQPTEDLTSPIKNIGGKQSFDNMDIRRYTCMQCGYSWKTKEVFYDEIKVQRNPQMSLFDKVKNVG